MSLTPLMRAARDGDLQSVRENLGEARKRDENGQTALMMAARGGHSSIVLLLEKEIGMKDSWGWTALMRAVYEGNLECANLLLSEIGKQKDDGWTALMLAAYYGKTDCARFLLSEAGKQNNAGETALMMAAKNGHSNLIPHLEKEIGMKDNNGRTALMWAASNGRLECVKLLLSEAEMRTTKEWKITSNGNTVTFPPGTTALMLAAHWNYPEVVELLLPYEQGLKDSKGHTAKWHANNSSRRGDFTKVRELLRNEGKERVPPPSNSAEVPKLREGNSQLSAEVEALKKELASSRNAHEEAEGKLSQLNREVASLKEQLSRSHTDSEALKRELANQRAWILALEEENARLRNESLISSAIRGDLEVLRKHLDQAGQQDATGMTALMYAALHGQTEAVHLLRPLEARLQDGKGQTALMYAVRRRHGDCVRLLLLEQDIKDREGRTAADHAVDKEMRRTLLHQPPFPTLPDGLSTYQLTAVLGRGAFGTVYAAHGNGKNVAVKVVDLGRHSEELREKLREEAKILTSLDHPNIIRCLGVGENNLEETYIFVTEMCCGDLRGEIRRREKAMSSYSDQEVWRVIRDVAAALTYLHKKRVAHRDLKPANVLLAPDGRCVLGDFGVTKALGDSSQMSTFVGTMPYMAPEIHRREKYDKSVDVWALGVVAYEICTGRFPFFDNIAIIQRDPPAIEGRDQELADIIHRMLSKDPGSRPKAQDVLEETEKH